MRRSLLPRICIASVFLSVLVVGVAGALASKVNIVYYHRSSITESEWANEVIALFNAQHDDIEVSSLPSGTGGGADYAEKLAVLRASGNAPDVFFGCADKLGYVLKGWALDLTGYVTRDKAAVKSTSFFPGVWDSFNYGGKIYGIPLSVTPQILFYNKDMFEKHGLTPLPPDWEDRTWTWDTMIEYSKKLTLMDADGSATQLALTQATEAHLPDIPWMFGGDWFDEEAYRTTKATRATIVRDENIRAYEALIDLYDRYAAVGSPKGISAGTGFVEGRIAMDWIGSWKLNSYIEVRRSGGLKFGLGMGPVPLVQNRQNTRWTDPLFISSTTQHPDAAWEFVKFATNEECQGLWTEITRQIPARRTVLGTYVRGAAQFSGVDEEEIATAVGGALTASRRALEESIGELPLIISARHGEWIGPMLAGMISVKSALTDMESALNAIIASSGK